MITGSRQRPILAVVAALLLIALLAGGGLYVRWLISHSFRLAGVAGATRALTYETLRYMLDEETGLRGFAATGDRQFLEPYQRALAPFQATARQLRTNIVLLDLPQASAAIDELSATNAAYLHEVAPSLLARPHGDLLAAERRGKLLVDHFREVVATLDALLAERERVINLDAEDSIARIRLLTGAAVGIVLLLSFLYVRQQAGLARRIERERVRTAEQRRETDLLRAAYQAEKRIADTLQEAFVQRPLPNHPTLRFSATYVPATEETKVGGDWYDALELPDNRVLFTIGDVTGHGIRAAVTMNRVRQALISSALFDPMPAALLGRVAHELHAEGTPLVTAVAGFADANTYEFVYSAAGHPPPMLLEPGRPPRMLESGGLPLGAMADAEYRNVRVQSVPGAMLVLYTDGAIEHSRDVIEGESILLAAAAEAVRVGPADPATFIHNAVFDGREVGDDVAILTVGFAPEPALGVAVSADQAQSTFHAHFGSGQKAAGRSTAAERRRVVVA